ncbi:hypothetical protein B7463_g7365, partial [Scytalidium lignicola]
MAPSTMTLLAGSTAIAIVLDSKSPQYTINQSRSITAACLFGLALLGQLIYTAVLYPCFLTPFKSLPKMNLFGRLMNRRDIEAAFTKLASTFNHDGLLRCYMPHGREMLLILNSEGLADILVRKPYNFVKPDHIKFDLSYLFAKGLFVAEGEEHKLLRKNLSPAFAFRHIKNLYPLFWTKSIQMADAMEHQIGAEVDGNRVIKMHDWTTRATLDIVGVAGMGFDFRSLQEPENRIHQEYKRITSSSRQPTLLLGLARSLGLETIFQLGLKIPSRAKRIRAAALQTVRGVAAEVVRAHTIKKGDANEMHTDIVSDAVHSGAFSEEDLVDETMTFVGAGHESTSAAFLWAVYALCRHPSIQERLREEIHANLDVRSPSAGPSVTDKVDNMPYLNAFCNELLRFYPSVPVTLRRTVCDTTVDGLFVPAETMLALPIRAINHDPRHWGPDAADFDPSRWLKPGMSHSGGATSSYANMTFLHGPRSCIGTSFARSELLFLIAALVGRFHMELENPDKEVECVLQITILPKDGLRVRMRSLGVPVKTAV